MAFNIYEAINGEETYAVTTSKNAQPLLRNTFQIEAVNESDSNVVRYGDKVRFVAYVNDKKVKDKFKNIDLLAKFSCITNEKL